MSLPVVITAQCRVYFGTRANTKKTDYVHLPHHVAAGAWWRTKLPEIAERNLNAMAEHKAKRASQKAKTA